MAEAPLPIIKLDERNEAEILAEAIQRVYTVSGRKLNDFSAGSPLLALLEGQVFAGAELLAYANRLPAAFTIEFLARIFGIKRSLGKKARATVEITLSAPGPQPLVIPQGTVVRTAEGLGFLTVAPLVFNSNEVTKAVGVIAQSSGAASNVPAHSITEFAVKPARVGSVTNPEAAIGGTNEESLEDVLGRGFSFVNTTLPVGLNDWVSYIEEFLGIGAPIIIRNRRNGLTPSNDNQLINSGRVNIWVLDQNGQALNNAALAALRDHISRVKPLHYEIRLFNCNVQTFDLRVRLGYNQVAQNPQEVTELLNEALRQQLRPHSGGPNFAGENLPLDAIRRVIYDAAPDYELIELVSPDMTNSVIKVVNDFTALRLGQLVLEFQPKNSRSAVSFTFNS